MPIASIVVPCVIVPNNPRKIREDEVALYRENGWQIKPDDVVCEDGVQELVAMPVPVSTPDPVVSDLDKLEKEVNKVIGPNPIVPKRKAGRPPKRW